MTVYDKYGFVITVGDLVLIGHNNYGIREGTRAVVRKIVRNGNVKLDVFEGEDAQVRVISPVGTTFTLMK